MTTKEKLLALKEYTQRVCCAGRIMKTPGKNMRITDIEWAEPKVFLGLPPTKLGNPSDEYIPANVHPCIMVAFGPGKARDMEEKRFDRYSKVTRPQDLGYRLAASFLFCAYEPGNRLPGFDAIPTPDLIEEGTEDGLFVLVDWMDTLQRQLLADNVIPGTDMFVDERSITYSQLMESGFIVDKRPFWYGVVTCELYSYSQPAPNDAVSRLLD